MRLSGEGLRLELPPGWEGAITRNPARSRSQGRPPFDGEVPGRRPRGLDPDDVSSETVPDEEAVTDVDENPGRSGRFGTDAPTRTEVEQRVEDNLGPTTEVAEDGSVVMPVTHLANFALPAAVDVFGTQVVETMTAGDSFLALVEYGPAEVGTPLFERRGVPRRLSVRDFSPKSLNRTIPDQSGVQVFATEAGRAFCLYAVVAGRAGIGAIVRDLNAVLSTLEVQPR